MCFFYVLIQLKPAQRWLTVKTQWVCQIQYEYLNLYLRMVPQVVLSVADIDTKGNSQISKESV